MKCKLNNTMLHLFKHFFIFLLSGGVYYFMEVMFKGSERGSHWSMFLLAGISGVLFIDGLNNLFTYEMDFLLQIFLCATFITIGEYLVGCCVNQSFEIWDYRNMPLNYKGQICVPFYFLWCALSAIFIPILDYIEWKVFGYKKLLPPYYKIFGKKVFQFKSRKEENKWLY